MWVAGWLRRTEEPQETTNAESGTVTIGGSTAGVLSRGEERNVPLASPGGYAWRPKNGERVLEDVVEKLTLFLDRVEATGEDALFLGDGAPGFEAAIRERLGDKAHFAQPQHNGLRAGSACTVAAQKLEKGEAALDYITLLPLYLRAPQAERERAAREGAQHG